MNTTGFTAALPLPTTSNFGVVRLDHAFGSKWQAFGSYRIYKEISAVNRQVDIGGLYAGDVKGQPTSVANIPQQPRYLVFGLTGTLTPNITNELNVSYTREWWFWNTASAFPQVPGTAAALELGGNSASPLLPINLNTTGARQRLWNGHNYNLADNLSWLKGTHFIRAGGTFSHAGVKFSRDDGQVGLIEPAYLIQQSTGLNIPSDVPAAHLHIDAHRELPAVEPDQQLEQPLFASARAGGPGFAGRSARVGFECTAAEHTAIRQRPLR